MAKTLARYPIKSGPKQFSAYLTDMSSLLIEVLSGGMMVPVGYAEVTDIGKISPSSPVQGYIVLLTIFSSPELKAQVSFSDRLLSVCPPVHKLFTFSSSSQEPLGQFQPTLAQSILR